MCFEDSFYANPETLPLLTVGTTIESRLDYCPDDFGEFTNDVDWYRLDITPGRFYEVVVTATDHGTIQANLVNQNDRQLLNHDFIEFPTGQDRDVIVARQPGRHLISISDPMSLSESRYELTLRNAPDIPSHTETWAPVATGSYYSDIESATDLDSFRFTAFANRGYDIEVLGASSADGTLSDPILRIYDDQGNRIAFDSNSGKGTNAFWQWKPTANSRDLFVEAGGFGGSGTYSLRITQTDDLPIGPATNARLPIVSNQTRSRYSFSERSGDIDWVKVDLEAGRRYQFRSRNGDFDLLLRDPQNNVVASYNTVNGDKRDQIFFQAQQSGTHHLVIRGRGEIEDFVAVTDNVAPPLRSRQTLQTLGNQQRQSLAQLLETPSSIYERFQVLPMRPISFGETTLAPNQPHWFSREQLNQVFVGALPNVTGEIEVFVRGDTGGEHRYVTGWTTVNAYKYFDRSAEIASGQFWSESPTYYFADSAPDYYGGQHPDASHVGNNVQSKFTDVIRSWNLASEGLLRQVGSTDNADIVIFAADIDRNVSVSGPGAEMGGDIILDSSVFNASTDFSDSRLTYEINRAIGRSLGLRNETSTFRPDQTVIGTRNQAFFENVNAWPETPSHMDAQFVQNLYGPAHRRFSGREEMYSTEGSYIRTFNGDWGSDPERPWLSFEPRTVVANGFFNTRFDLRRGRSSYRFVDGRYQAINNGVAFDVNNAKGTARKDVLVGNSNNNVLEAGAGDDALFGGRGDDILNGGIGNDFYHYQFGDGNDIIRESVKTASWSDNVDTLRIEGRFGFDDLTDDLTFQRFGDQLTINLDLNGGYNRRNGSITLSNVNRLVLTNEQGRFGNAISLASIFDQADYRPQRFETNGQFDEFGALAQPV